MSDGTNIAYADATWPIVAGCEKASGGCANCSAIMDSWRMAHNPNPKVSAPYAGTVAKRAAGNLAWSGVIRPLVDRLDWPLKWRKPRAIFVCNLADLFHPAVPDKFIDAALGAMGACQQHTFLVLTKQPGRMLQYLAGIDPTPVHRNFRAAPKRLTDAWDRWPRTPAVWPLPNVVIGVSVEDQSTSDARRPPMEAIAALGWRTWVSYEPALGAVDWRPWMRFLHAAVVGGESGKAARPMHPDWPRSLRDQCETTGVRFHFKQWAKWRPAVLAPIRGQYAGGSIFLRPDGSLGCQGDWWDGKAAAMDKVGARTDQVLDGLLDGRSHTQFPGDVR